MKTLYEKMERGRRTDYSPEHEGAFVELLNKEMEELLRNLENNEELKKLHKNNLTNSKGVINEKERN